MSPRSSQTNTASDALQDIYGPRNACFGCGPSNPKGLQIKSYVDGDSVVATFTPEPHHQAFEGIINGGIIGTILDCHMNWAAAWHIKTNDTDTYPEQNFPYTVTAIFTVELLAPTPAGVPLQLVATVADSSRRRANIEADLIPQGDHEPVVTAKGTGTFVAVGEDHPAHGRW